MPQNLPGFGFNHDNMAQNGVGAWTRVISPAMVNTASAPVRASRCSTIRRTTA